MEYLDKILKKTGWSSLITSIIFAVLGIVLIANPEATVTVIAYILGILFIIVGAYKVIVYLENKGKYDFYNYDMAFGIIAVVLGFATIGYRSQISSVLRIIIGLWVIYSSVIRINLSFKLKALETKMWVYSLIIAIVMALCGIFIVFNKGVVIMTIGVIVLIYSILDIAESVIFLKNVDEITKE